MASGGYNPKPTIEFIKESFKNANMELLESVYFNAHTKMKYKCSCGYEGEVVWNSFQQGTRCPICAIQKIKDKQKLNYEDVKLEFEKYGFKLIDDYYENTNTPMLCYCKCGEIIKTTLDSVRRGSGCKKCGVESMKNKQKLSYEFVKNYFSQYGYILLEDNYINWETKMKYQCNKGHINFMDWNTFKNGCRCPDCAGVKKKTIEYVKQEFEKCGYELLDDVYINNETPLNYRCPNGHLSRITWANFQFGQRCKFCYESKGEERIFAYLIKNDFNFIREYRMAECRYKNPLPFDFAIFNEKNELQYLIEYDGEQHFKSVEAFGGDMAFESLKTRDLIKTNYCQENNINLIRIPFTEINNIEIILDKIFYV